MQRQLVAKVDQLMALVDELETQPAASRTTAANLLEPLASPNSPFQLPDDHLPLSQSRPGAKAEEVGQTGGWNWSCARRG